MLKISITLPNNAQINLESEDELVIDKILGMVLLDITRDMLVSPPAANGNATPVPPPEERAAPAVTARPAPAVSHELTPVPPPNPVLPDAGLAPPEVDMTPAANPETLPSAPPPARPAGVANNPPSAGYGAGFYREPGAAPGQEPEADWPGDEEYDNEFEDDAEPEMPQVAGLVGMGMAVGSGVAPARPIVSSLAEQAFIDFCRAANPLGDMRRVVVAAEGASRYLGMDGVDAEELGRLFDLAAWPRPHNFVQTLRNAARSKFGWLERVPGRAGHYSVTDLGRATALGR